MTLGRPRPKLARSEVESLSERWLERPKPVAPAGPTLSADAPTRRQASGPPARKPATRAGLELGRLELQAAATWRPSEGWSRATSLAAHLDRKCPIRFDFCKRSLIGIF